MKLDTLLLLTASRASLSALVVGAIVATNSLGWQIILAHAVVIVFVLGVVDAISLIAKSFFSPRCFSIATIFLSSVAILFLLLFYVTLFLTLYGLKDYPTWQLVKGYSRDLVGLIGALPIDPALTMGAVAAFLVGASLLALRGAFWTYQAINKSAIVNHRSIEQSFLARSLIYLLIVATSLTVWMPPSVLLESKEPLLSILHNVRLSTSSQYSQRNPVESAADVQARRDFLLQKATRTPNIIVVYVDALRADLTQPYGTAVENMPHLARRVASGELHQVEDVYAACSATICGLAALLQSRPTRLQSPENYSLPKALADLGYKNYFILSSNHQDYFDLKSYYSPTEFYLDGKDLSAKRSADDYLVLKGIDKLPSWDSKPALVFLGLVSTHAAGIKHEENRKFLPDKISTRMSAEEFRKAFTNNYFNGVLQADFVIQHSMEKLERLGYFNEEAILVITSDHGESVGENGIYGHVKSLNVSELRIPLWIRNPYMTVKGNRPALQIDVAPTLIASLGIRPPKSWHGSSLDAIPSERISEHFVQDLPHLHALIWSQPGSVQLMYLFNSKEGQEQVFDLESDPLGRYDVARKLSKEQVEMFRDKLRRIGVSPR